MTTEAEDFDQPMALGGGGESGPRSMVGKDAQRKRASMRQLLINGLGDDDIAGAMQAEFGMSFDETMALKRRIEDKLICESEERRPLKKALAEQRLHRHIIQAGKRNQWGAVAALETTLAKVQGTEEPVEQKLLIDQRVTAAAFHVLGNLTPDEVAQLIQSEVPALPGSTAPVAITRRRAVRTTQASE